jgi:hypothetical protein
MVKIVNSSEGARLRELSEFKEMLSDEYLFNLNVRQTKFIYEQFFKGDSATVRLERLKLLNITLSLPSTIGEKLADFVGAPNMPYDVDVFENVVAFSWGGYSVMKTVLQDGEFKVEYASPDGYVKYDDGSEQIITFIEVEDEGGNKIDYVFSQYYTFGEILNELYILDRTSSGADTAIYGNKVSLDEIEATRGMVELEKTGLRDTNPIVVVNNALLGSKKYGRSEVKRIRSILSSIETQVVNIQDQFLKHLSAILALPMSKLPVDKKGFVDVRKLEVVGMEAGDTLPSFVSNINPLIDKSFQQIESLLLQIGAILSIPVEFFNIKATGGVEAAEAKSIRLAPFLKKVERTRDKFEKGFQKIHEIAKKWGVGETDELNIMWGDVFKVDKGSEVVELVHAQDGGLISRKRAIMRYQDVDEETALAEKEEIDAERATITEPELTF